MDPAEIQPGGPEVAGAAPAGTSSVRHLFWDGEHLMLSAPDALESVHDALYAVPSAGATAADSERGDRPTPKVIADGAELLREFERDGGAELTYWVPEGEGLVPATPEQVERFREYDRELVARYRLQVWRREERRRARWRLPRRLARLARARLAGGARRMGALARGAGCWLRGARGAAHDERSAPRSAETCR
jgi:hypothetical protein